MAIHSPTRANTGISVIKFKTETTVSETSASSSSDDKERGLRPVPSYKPTVLKTPVVLAVVFACLFLIGVVEYACRKLPTEISRTQHYTIPASTSLQKRQFVGPSSPPREPSNSPGGLSSIPREPSNYPPLTPTQPILTAPTGPLPTYADGPTETRGPSRGSTVTVTGGGNGAPPPGIPIDIYTETHHPPDPIDTDSVKPDPLTETFPIYTRTPVIPPGTPQTSGTKSPFVPPTSYLNTGITSVAVASGGDVYTQSMVFGTVITGDPGGYVNPGISQYYQSFTGDPQAQGRQPNPSPASSVPLVPANNASPSPTPAVPGLNAAVQSSGGSPSPAPVLGSPEGRSTGVVAPSGPVFAVPSVSQVASGAAVSPGVAVSPGAAAYGGVSQSLKAGSVVTLVDANGKSFVSTIVPTPTLQLGTVMTLTDSEGKAFLTTISPAPTLPPGSIVTMTDSNGKAFVSTVPPSPAGPVVSYTDSMGSIRYTTLRPSPHWTAGAVITSYDPSGQAHLVTIAPPLLTSFTITGRNGQVSTVTLASYSSKTATSTDATGGVHVSTVIGGKPITTSGPNNINRPVKTLTNSTYFVASYLPTVIAIFLRIIVGLIYAATKMLEPFYSLADPTSSGVLVKDFLNVNYLATNDSFDPALAVFTGHRLMLFMSILYTFVGLITPFASEFTAIFHFCNAKELCAPEMRMNPIVGRVIEALLGCAAIMLIIFWFIERRKRSGLFSDPSSIASMATLFHHPQVVQDFQRLDPDASKKDMEVLLADNRYRLGYYEHRDGSERYGIIPAVKQTKSKGLFERKKTFKRSNTIKVLHQTGLSIPGTAIGHTVTSAEHRHVRAKKREVYHVGRDLMLGGVTIAALVIIVWHYLNSNQNAFERWLNDGKHFGPRFFFSILGVLIHSQWKRLERDICILQPFRTLTLGRRPTASKSILIERTLSPFTTLFASLRHGRLYPTLAALNGVLAEILIVTLSGIPFNDGQLFTAFCVSSYLSIGILSFMLLTLIAVYLRPGGEIKLPRTPNTIGGVLSYLCASSMLRDFAGLSTLTNKMKRSRIKDMGRRYTFDVLQCSDGVNRWTIDYDRTDLEA